MSKQRPNRRKAEDVSRVDHLLSLLGDLSQRDPSPALRERLDALATRQLKVNPTSATRPKGRDRWKPAWLKPAFAATLLAAIGMTPLVVVHFRREVPPQTGRVASVNRPALRSGSEPTTPAAPKSRHGVANKPRVHHLKRAYLSTAGARQMTMRLPYSNSAIETGTDTTIRVSMSQSELLSLGFPIGATIPDRRIVAELTLGDDGLPRAISVPLPLVVMKEKQ